VTTISFCVLRDGNRNGIPAGSWPRMKRNRANSDYVLFTDYWFAPSGEVWAVHFVVCDRAGDWVIVVLQNSHQEDFQRLNPKTLEDCDRLVLERLKNKLR